jgi:hypothetical protein
MDFTLQSKSNLAKLLAVENLRVEHSAGEKTASMDLKNRVLYLPIWTEMSGHIYDLLVGHEVSHALDTPPEGWHNAIEEKGVNYKHFLNIVEDARIEKRIKRRYPGLRKSFNLAYKEFMDRDFFGVKDIDLNTCKFIDRLNMHFKIGSMVTLDFNEREQILINQTAACETWEDVRTVTDLIWEYSKEEQNSKKNQQKQKSKEKSEDGSQELKSEAGEESDNQTDVISDKKSDSVNEKQTNDETQSSSVDNQTNDSGNNDEPTSVTDSAFRENEQQLISSQKNPYLYLNIPDVNLQNVITPHNRVHELIEKSFSTQQQLDTLLDTDVPNQYVSEFKKRNERYIGLLSKEFEMRKAAKSFSRTKISETGDINLNKISQYMIDDNIFRTMAVSPKGKSHGLVLVFDRSGSMEDKMRGTIEQILILASFCRRVNIPFVVYGFGNNSIGRKIDLGVNPTLKKDNTACFTMNKNDLCCGEVYLREYMNSKMTTTEFNKALSNMLMVANTYRLSRDRSRNTYYRLPESETLSNTPLIESIIALKPITDQFRKVNKLDIVNTVVVHDGDADDINRYYTSEPQEDVYPSTYYFNRGSDVIVRDSKTKFEAKIDKDYTGLQKAIFDYYTETTGSKIFGYFICSPGNSRFKNSIHCRYYSKDGLRTNKMTFSETADVVNKGKKDKFVLSHNPGYKEFYIIPSDDLVSDDEFEIVGTPTPAKLKKAFTEFNKSRLINRALVGRFIQGIAL